MIERNVFSSCKILKSIFLSPSNNIYHENLKLRNFKQKFQTLVGKHVFEKHWTFLYIDNIIELGLKKYSGSLGQSVTVYKILLLVSLFIIERLIIY